MIPGGEHVWRGATDKAGVRGTRISAQSWIMQGKRPCLGYRCKDVGGFGGRNVGKLSFDWPIYFNEMKVISRP